MPRDTFFGRLRGALTGRSNRREYWLSILGLVVLNVVLTAGLQNPMLTSLISFPIWVFIASRRLHDFGQTGWWSLIPFGAGFVLGLARGAGIPFSSSAETMTNAAVMLVMLIVVGSVPGAPGPNRFGE